MQIFIVQNPYLATINCEWYKQKGEWQKGMPEYDSLHLRCLLLWCIRSKF